MSIFERKPQTMLRLSANHYVSPEDVRSAEAKPADKYTTYARVTLFLVHGRPMEVPARDLDEAQAICARIRDAQGYKELP